MDKKIVLAGGHFWSLARPLCMYKGIKSIICGYECKNADFDIKNAAGEEYYHAVEIIYDQESMPLADILAVYFRQINPIDGLGQFLDRGLQYRTAIFYIDDDQRRLAERAVTYLNELDIFNYSIKTKVLAHRYFQPAEERYQHYQIDGAEYFRDVYRCSGRYEFIREYWDMNKAKKERFKDLLSPIGYEVTQNNMTEIPFDNEYCDFFEDGVYVDPINNQPLFSSEDKIESSKGWPSFTKPYHDRSILIRPDFSMGLNRYEVRSLVSNSHLGHIIEEDGKYIYQINSAALKFFSREEFERLPKEDEEEKYFSF